MSLESHPSGSSSDGSPSAPSSKLRVPRALMWCVAIVIGWFAIGEIGTEAWYRWRESQAPLTTPWTIDWPTEENAAARGLLDFSVRELGSVEQELLHFEQAKSASWRDGAKNMWTAFYLKWGEDKRLNQTDLAHNPTSCLPAAGLKLVSAEPDVTVEVSGQPVTFRSWIFSLNDTPVYVFTATRRERELQRFSHEGDKGKKLLDKFRKPWLGNRANPLQTLQFVVVGPRSMPSAEAALADAATRLVSSGTSPAAL